MVFMIADDLTGACDSSIQYRKNGWKTVAQTAYDGDALSRLASRFDTVAVNADSRPVSPKEAYRLHTKIGEQIMGLPHQYIYKKLDSILRGNPAQELDALMDVSGADWCIVAPGYPRNGRRMKEGVIYYGSHQINAWEVLGRRMKYPAALVPVSVVRQGRKAVEKELEAGRRSGIRVFLADAETEEDLEVLAHIGINCDGKKILCGSAGYAAALSAVGAPGMEKKSRSLLKADRAMVIIGSRSQETVRQVQKAKEDPNVALLCVPVNELLSDRESVLDKLVCRTERLLGGNIRVLLIVLDSLLGENGGDSQPEQEKAVEPMLPDPNKYREPVILAQGQSRDSSDKSRYLVEALGELAWRINRKQPMDAVFASGGDTAREVCRSMGIRELILLEEPESGIPVSRSVLPDGRQLLVITKSGGFGTCDTLVRILRYIGCLG